ncbi:MAG: CSLREA domain-containing protein [Actinomycetota bacterium]
MTGARSAPPLVARTRIGSMLLGCTLAMGLLAPGVADAAPEPVVLQNPGAEAGVGSQDAITITAPPGWTTTPKFTAVAYGAPAFPDAADSTAIGGEANFFAGGPDAGVSTAEQTVSVSGDAVAIDASRAEAVLSAHLGGFDTQGDEATVTATFLGGANNDLGTLSIGPVTVADRGGETKLLFRTGQATVPPGTRSVEVTMTATRVNGFYNDGYLDNVSLALDVLFLVVNSTADPGSGTCDATECTLREAIAAANATSGFDFIKFDLPAGSSIVPGSPLPPITEAVSIDGTMSGAPGIELAGSAAGNGTKGLEIRAPGVTVRGLAINRFSGAGIALVNTAGGAAIPGPTIRGNYIGTDLTGQMPLGNGGAGIDIGFFTGAAIGGSAAGQGNVISANAGEGIKSGDVTGAGSDHQIVGNHIGTNVAGTTDLGNGVGVHLIGSPGNLISGNVVSSNAAEGVAISFAGATQNLIYGNRIGVGADGSTPIGNGNHGVAILVGHNNRIGGVLLGEGNVIAHNGGDGVFIAAPNNQTMGNSIFSNGQLGIDLVDGTGGEVTPNDPGDADGGGFFNSNHLQNFPVLTSATVGSSVTTVTGTINSTPSFFFDIELFGSPTCDPSGHGEGRTFLGRAFVIADGGGNAAFTTTLPPVAPGTFVTATATDPNADTSEFSACVQSTGPGGGSGGQGGGAVLAPKQVTLKANPKKVEKGDKIKLTATVTPCPGHQGDLVEFYRGTKVIATKASNQSCVAKHQEKVTNKSKFHAVSPMQDADHLAGTSGKVTVKIKKP